MILVALWSFISCFRLTEDTNLSYFHGKINSGNGHNRATLRPVNPLALRQSI